MLDADDLGAMAVLVNSFVLSTLINRYFVGYAKVN
jgi:hypothetical protein